MSSAATLLVMVMTLYHISVHSLMVFSPLFHRLSKSTMRLKVLSLLGIAFLPPKLLAVPPSSSIASEIFQQGNTLYAAEDFEGAISSYKKAIDMEQHADFFCNLASVYYDLQNMEESERNYKQALELQPSHTSALFNYALLLQDKRAHLEAASLYERLLLLENNNADVFSNLGSCYYELQRYAEAAELFQKAIVMYEYLTEDENMRMYLHSSLHEYIGRCFSKLNDSSRAKDHFSTAVLLNSEVINTSITPPHPPTRALSFSC